MPRDDHLRAHGTDPPPARRGLRVPRGSRQPHPLADEPDRRAPPPQRPAPPRGGGHRDAAVSRPGHGDDLDVHRALPPRRSVIESDQGPVPFRGIWELEAAGGATRFTWTLETGGLAGRLAGAVATRLAREELAGDTLRLKALLEETRVRPGGPAPAPSVNSPFDLMIGVPIDSSGAFVGCERLPAALARGRDRGGDAAIHPTTASSRSPSPTRCATSRTGWSASPTWPPPPRWCAASWRRILPQGRTPPLVLGGCCTLLLGVMAALRDGAEPAAVRRRPHRLLRRCHLARRRGGRHGARDPAGRGGAAAHRVAGKNASQDRRVVALGRTDEQEAAGQRLARPARDSRRTCRSSTTRRATPATPPGTCGRALVAPATTPRGSGCTSTSTSLSKPSCPPSTTPHDRGLTWDELLELLRARALPIPRLLGTDMTILNPAMDPGNRYGARAVRLSADALST